MLWKFGRSEEEKTRLIYTRRGILGKHNDIQNWLNAQTCASKEFPWNEKHGSLLKKGITHMKSHHERFCLWSGNWKKIFLGD